VENFLRRFEMPSRPASPRTRVATSRRSPRLFFSAAAALLAAGAVGILALALGPSRTPPIAQDPEPPPPILADVSPPRRAPPPTRVLFVDQLPRWEYRYLKNALVRDPEILAHCWLTSAERDFPQAHSLRGHRPKAPLQADNEFFQPLPELPRDLSRYTVVVIGDVPAEQLGDPFLRALEWFVREEGGGLVLLAGTRYNPVSYKEGALARLTPVQLEQRPNVESGLPCRLRPVASHPALDILKGPLPELYWVVQDAKLKAGAATIAEAVFQEGSSHPLFVSSRAGRGRVFLSLTDETWRWRSSTGDEPWYFAFWRRVFEWASEFRKPPRPPAAASASIRGLALFEGDPPARGVHNVSGDPKCAALHAKPIPREDLLIENGRVRNVLVWVKRGLEGIEFDPPREPALLDQRGCMYVPHVRAVVVGQPLQIKNSDNVLHNVSGNALKRNRSFNFGQDGKGKAQEVAFRVPEIGVPIRCDVHSWMGAVLHVLLHPKFAVTGEDGAFEIEGLPPGEYEVEAWHEVLGTRNATIRLESAGSKDISFTFERR
jgi:uncharacterized membrane protein